MEDLTKKVTSKIRNLFVLILVIGILGVGGYRFYKSATKPLPGQAVADLGREHVPDGTEVEYNSNPPTSGPHYGEWARAGVYDEPLADGLLIHSLEHGYVIMSYNCEREGNCEDLVAKLAGIYEKKGKKKLIVIPRPSLDSRIALTAWRKIDKFDKFDEGRIVSFIDALRDRGPEQTIE